MLLVCVRMIEQYGMNEVGIFRISAAVSELDRAMATIEKPFSLSSKAPVLPPNEPHLYAHLMKQFLRSIAPLGSEELVKKLVPLSGLK